MHRLFFSLLVVGAFFVTGLVPEVKAADQPQTSSASVKAKKPTKTVVTKSLVKKTTTKRTIPPKTSPTATPKY